ncbi:MAG: nucleoside recognition protein [Lachnospiraceae bacterium]|nr:nucleoside recognition protein [Lachnospiraceae bacterium]
MLNYIWAAMIFIGVIYGAVNGTMKEITEAALQSAGEAVSLCISTAGIMAFWVGLMEIAEKSGLIEKLTGFLSPFITFMFPAIPKGHKARDYISTNIIANILGLGWAATPAGLKAMEALAELEEERRGGARTGTEPGRDESTGDMPLKKVSCLQKRRKLQVIPRGVASNEMCTFLILNISSLQLIPVNMIAYRQQYGSVNPAVIVGPAIAATALSTAAAIVFCKVMDGRRRFQK